MRTHTALRLPPSSPQCASRTLIADAIACYLQTKRALGCNFNSEERALHLFARCLAEWNITYVDQVTDRCVDRFIAPRPLEPRSFNGLLGCVRRLFEWLVDQNEISVSPVRTPVRRETSRRLPYLFQEETLRELIRLAEHLPDWSRCPLDGSHGDLCLKGRAVISSCSSRHVPLLVRGILAAIRQGIHLSACSVLPDHL